jgi:hypothetical protein
VAELNGWVRRKSRVVERIRSSALLGIPAGLATVEQASIFHRPRAVTRGADREAGVPVHARAIYGTPYIKCT